VTRRRSELPAPAFDIRGAIDLLREIVGRTDALIYSAERHFERFGWRCITEGDETERPLDHLAHLLAAAREAAISAVSAGDVIVTELAKRQTRRDTCR
jgi:hypothetical protein